jgi:transcription antitermination factor NusG
MIRCVTFNREPAFIKQEEVDSIKLIMENDFSYEVSCNLKIGDLVVIKEGALAGMEGVLVEERGNCRFAVKIESLRQSVLVNIPTDYVEHLEVAV